MADMLLVKPGRRSRWRRRGCRRRNGESIHARVLYVSCSY